MAKDSAAPFGDDGTTAELYRRRARNPLRPRAAVEELLASMNRIIEITEPDPALPAALNFSQSRRAALAAKRGIEKGWHSATRPTASSLGAASCRTGSRRHCKR